MSKSVAVIGAGTIGASWASIFLAQGLAVRASDPSPQGEAFARRFVANAWPTLEALGWVVAGASQDNLSFHASPTEACEGVSFVQESGPEREDIKIETFKELDAATPKDVVIASSSSGLLITRVTVKCAHAERCVIGHPFNPPHLIPLVEVVAGEKTSQDAVDKAMAFYRSIGKHPIHIKKEVKGHVANRLQAALWREAVNLVAHGVCSVADADAAIAYGPGLRWALMGPHLTFHLAGGEGGMTHFMNHLTPALQTWMDDLGNPRILDYKQVIIDGVAEEAGNRSIADLQKWRDRKLVDILKVSSAP